MSPLLERLDAASKQALKARDKSRLDALRLMIAEVKKVQIDRGRAQTLGDPELVAILDKMVKQRKESLAIYREAGRDALADQEEYELRVIQEFLPEPLTEAELQALLEEALNATGASSLRDMGKVMAHLKPQVQGRADMQQLSKAIKSKLGA